ncbi:MAG: glycosyltransferase family 4 protein [Opitutales bacterium]
MANTPIEAYPQAPPIFLFTHEFSPVRGGIATFCEEMAFAATELGHSVEVWAPPGDNKAEWPFWVHRTLRAADQNTATLWRTGRVLAAEKKRWIEGILYLPEPGPITALAYACRFSLRPPSRLFLTLHGSEILRWAKHPWVALLMKDFLPLATRIGVPSGFTLELLRQNFPEAVERATITSGARRTFPRAPSGPARRASSRRRIVVLTVARLHPRKGQEKMIEALLRLPPRLFARIEYRIAGSGNRPAYEKKLRNMAAAAPFPVSLLGGLSDPEREKQYREADIFAMTSIRDGNSVEGFGLVYLEAASHGLPVIAHATGGAGEAVRANETGFVVPPERGDLLTHALRLLIENEPMRRQMGDAGRTHAKEYSWEETARNFFLRRDLSDPLISKHLPL